MVWALAPWSVKCSVVSAVSSWESSTRSSSSGEGVQGLQEALVLGAGSVGHPQVAWTTERGSRANGHTGLCQGRHHLGLVEVPEGESGEIGLRLRGLEAHLAQCLLHE